MTISIIKNHSGDTVGIITGCSAQLDYSYSWAKSRPAVSSVASGQCSPNKSSGGTMKNALTYIKLIAAALAVDAIIVMVAYSCVGPEVGV